jgi:hypothetical protein
MALEAAGKKVSPTVKQRLSFAADFFRQVQTRKDCWDYGDSDSAFVTPFFANETDVIPEWHAWFEGAPHGLSIAYWLGENPLASITSAKPHRVGEIREWWLFPDSGMAIEESGFWFLRWDLSPLGYLATAAHGHLDALHLSIWFRGVAMVVDPGTGAYYGDKNLRSHLASAVAHNGPVAKEGNYPQRLGPFLWAKHHLQPKVTNENGHAKATLILSNRKVVREIESDEQGLRWTVIDACVNELGAPSDFSVHWQFAPGAFVKIRGPRGFELKRNETTIRVDVSNDWTEVTLVENSDDAEMLEGTVSSGFRRKEWAPFLKLTARPETGKTCVYSTTFLASEHRE